MPSRFDRRRFVQSSLTAAGMLSLARLATAGQAPAEDTTNDNPAEDTQANDSADVRPVHVGVMGLSRGMALADTFASLPAVHVLYVCDVDQQRAASAAKRLAERFPDQPAPEAIGDFRRILDDPRIDALVCAAPNHWHGPATLYATAAGKHTYVEKPCCHNPQEGEWMIEAARHHQTLVQMGTQRRSSPGTIEAMRQLHSGVIGRAYMSRGWYSNRRPSIGRGQVVPVPEHLDYELWQGPAPRRDYLDNVVHYNWHWRWHWGDGELGNNGVHALDLCRWGLQVDFPTAVTSSGGRYTFDDDQETPDTHTVGFEFADDKAITWHGMSCNSFDSSWVTFYGDQGTLDLQPNGTFVVFDPQGKKVSEHVSSDGGDRRHIENFVAAIRANDASQLACDIVQAHRSTLLCHLGNIAHRVGQRLVCDPANGHVVDNPDAMRLWGRDYDANWKPPVPSPATAAVRG